MSQSVYKRQPNAPERGQIVKGGCTLCGAHEGDEACWDGVAYRWGCPILSEEELAFAEIVEDDKMTRITLLEDALEQAQHTVSFLHGCLTDPTYSYAYPDQTLRHLKEWAELVPVSEGCFHSRMRPEDCESCRQHIAKMKRLAEAYDTLGQPPPWK